MLEGLTSITRPKNLQSLNKAPTNKDYLYLFQSPNFSEITSEKLRPVSPNALYYHTLALCKLLTSPFITEPISSKTPRTSRLNT